MKKHILLFLIILATVFYTLCSELLLWLYPLAETEYNEFLKHYYLEDKLNDLLISIMFLVIFGIAKNTTKAVAIFGFTVSFASVIDKMIFGITDYLITDVVVLIVATLLFWVVYTRERRHACKQ